LIGSLKPHLVFLTAGSLKNRAQSRDNAAAETAGRAAPKMVLAANQAPVEMEHLAAVKERAKAKARVAAPATAKVAVSKAKGPAKAPAKVAKAGHKEAVVELAEAREAEAAPTRHRQIFLTAAMTTSWRVSFVRPQCRSKILSCARNSGRSTAITRRARAEPNRNETG
jgi:hypothetical protein